VEVDGVSENTIFVFFAGGVGSDGRIDDAAAVEARGLRIREMISRTTIPFMDGCAWRSCRRWCETREEMDFSRSPYGTCLSTRLTYKIGTYKLVDEQSQ